MLFQNPFKLSGSTKVVLIIGTSALFLYGLSSVISSTASLIDELKSDTESESDTESDSDSERDSDYMDASSPVVVM